MNKNKRLVGVFFWVVSFLFMVEGWASFDEGEWSRYQARKLFAGCEDWSEQTWRESLVGFYSEIAVKEKDMLMSRMLASHGVWIKVFRLEGKGVERPRRSQRLEITKAFLAAGADVNAVDEAGRTALAYAVLMGDREVVRLLIEAGADVNAVDNEGDRILYFGVFARQKEIVRKLLEAGADVNGVSQGKFTVLMDAAMGAQLEMVALLIEAGADADVITPGGLKAIDYAREAYKGEAVVDYLKEYTDERSALEKWLEEQYEVLDGFFMEYFY